MPELPCLIQPRDLIPFNNWSIPDEHRQFLHPELNIPVMDGPEAITETHSFHKSNLKGEQLRRLEILEWQCKMIRVSAGELSFCNCKAFLEEFARLKEGDRLFIERAEDSRTVWLDMVFHTKKGHYKCFRSWSSPKELLTRVC